MEFNPEKITKISEQLLDYRTYETGLQELTELMAIIVGDGDRHSVLKRKIEKTITHFPAEVRSLIVSELQYITEKAGWKRAHDITAGALDLDREIERVTGQREQVEIYPHTIKRPENIQNINDFLNPETGPSHYWIPRKYDIKRYVKTAVEAHKKSGRSGVIRVLDIGGGSGFLGKLITDEARNQGIPLEVTVLDPDTKTVAKAEEIFSDTENLKFEIGTSNDALSRFGPELADADKRRFAELDEKRLDLIEQGQEELAYTRALLVSLEGDGVEGADTLDISAILSGPFGNRTRIILEKSGLQLDNLPPYEEICNTLADFYNAKWKSLQENIISIRDEQEEIYAARGMGQAKIDVVLNSWMPMGLDFTREMRMLNAPAIIYATERSGATGVDYVGNNPKCLGKEYSYNRGNNYTETENSSWEGFAACEADSRRTEYEGRGANLSRIQTHKDAGISSQELEIPNPPDDEKYAWEESLEKLVGQERLDEIHFYWK